jgi:transposase
MLMGPMRKGVQSNVTFPVDGGHPVKAESTLPKHEVVAMAKSRDDRATAVAPLVHATSSSVRRSASLSSGATSQRSHGLGYHESVLNRWKRGSSKKRKQPGSGARPFPGNGNPRDEELAKLQRELARVKQENEILKKAVGIFTSRRREVPIRAAAFGAILCCGAMRAMHVSAQRLLRLAKTRSRRAPQA